MTFQLVPKCSFFSKSVLNCSELLRTVQTQAEVVATALAWRLQQVPLVFAQELVTADKGGEVFGIVRIESEDFDRLQHYVFELMCSDSADDLLRPKRHCRRNDS